MRAAIYANVSTIQSLGVAGHGHTAGRMVFTVLGAVAELESSLIAQRVRAGLRNARAKGKKLGRPRAVGGTERQGPRVKAHESQSIAANCPDTVIGNVT
jgi:hypothetical protein